MSVNPAIVSVVLKRLPEMIPSLNVGSQAILAGKLADALLALKGTSGTLTGALDGKLRLLDARDGSLLREFQTAKAFKADNGVEGHGGAIDVGGVVVAGPYLFVVSGYSMFGQMPGNMLLAYRLPE